MSESLAVLVARAPRAEIKGMTPFWSHPGDSLCATVAVTNIVDLRSVDAQRLAGLEDAALLSEPGVYGTCQRVGAVAHQLGAHGLLAPAATGLGETLTLFTRAWRTTTLSSRPEGVPPDALRVEDLGEDSTSGRAGQEDAGAEEPR